jgi:hypothetical protein
MESETAGREKTYLILLSFLIIANMFIPITFDKINILGNEASVPDGFVKSTIILSWLYFLWTFYQQTHWKYSNRYKSKIFTNVLQKYAENKLDKHAIKTGLYESKEQIVELGGKKLREPLTFHGCERVKGGYKITSELVNGYGDAEKHVMIIPRNEMLGSIFMANVSYIVRDPSYSRFTFPYVIALLAAFSSITSFPSSCLGT